LSPLLWNMVINSLLGRLKNESLWAQGFADDIAIVIYGKFLRTVCKLMQKHCLSFRPGVGRWGCLSMLIRHRWSFINNRKLVSFIKLIQFGRELQLKNQVKYLRVILDEKLNWNSHIDYRMQKATIAFWQCRENTNTETKTGYTLRW
jgi:hypothetical protein